MKPILLLLTLSFYNLHCQPGQSEIEYKSSVKFKLIDSAGIIITPQNILSKKFKILLQYGNSTLNDNFEIDSIGTITETRHLKINLYSNKDRLNIKMWGHESWSVLITHKEDSMYIHYYLQDNFNYSYDTLNLDVNIQYKKGRYFLLEKRAKYFMSGNPITHDLIPIDEVQPFVVEELFEILNVRERLKKIMSIKNEP